VTRDLHKLVERFGGYDRITAEAWAAFDAGIAAYHKRVRVIDTSPGAASARNGSRRNYSSFDECAACFARGVFGYRKQTLLSMGRPSDEPGELIWFCRKHMPARHFADARRDP
jgi:hypothetical protein